MKLHVLSHTIRVVCDDAKGWETGSHGQFTENDLIVRVRKGLEEQVKDLTICHELCHVIESLTGQPMTEQQIQCMALGWYSIIMENPEFIEAMWDK